MPGIVLVGEPGSGKTTIAQGLQFHGYEQMSFADPLKNEVAWICAQSLIVNNDLHQLFQEYQKIRKEMQDPLKKDKYRAVLQWWGTDWWRVIDNDHWIKMMRPNLKNNGKYVFDDCRFDNEWKMLKEHGFKLVRLESGETTRPVQEHASEVDWKLWIPDLVLSYESGPEHQAARIAEWINGPQIT